MAIKSLKHSSLTDNAFYRSVLAGNGAYFPVYESDDFLEEVVLSSDTATVSFTGLGSYSDYKHLQIRAVGQVNQTNDSLHNIFMRLNSDTGNNYAQHLLYGQGSSVIAGGNASTDFMYVRNVFGSKANTAYAGSVVIDFLDIHSSSKNTTMRGFGGTAQPGENQIGITSGLWNNTAAVTTILLYLNSGSFSAGARFSLYGSKG